LVSCGGELRKGGHAHLSMAMIVHIWTKSSPK
jgi:hypothetical protein